MTTHRVSQALQVLLDLSLRYPPEYQHQLSSHLPMALAALAGLGADEDRLRAFFAHYVRRFGDGRFAGEAADDVSTQTQFQDDPDADVRVLPADGWLPLRGRVDAFDVLRHHFGEQIERQGSDAVLRRSLPSLIDGIAAAAFHGAIRTAHAVESGHQGELAAALAYWAARWQPLAPPEAMAPAHDQVDRWLDAIGNAWLVDDDGRAPAGRLISLRMAGAAGSSAYRTHAGALRPAGRTPAALLLELSLVAARRYAATRNFTLLHLVTGARAARVLLPWLPQDAAALAPLWHAVAAASIASGAAVVPVDGPSDDGDDTLSWLQVRARALASNDDHVIKLVHAMVVQHDAVPDGAWLRAAHAAVADLADPSGGGL